MVQVDVFWAYGIGAGFGLASARQKTAPGLRGLLDSPRLRDTLLFQALVFVPSGFVLLWCFPSWETMHVGDRNLPGWLVALFAVTNVTQALLGFGVARGLAARGRVYAAYLQWLAGYFLMFFILVHGWDGTGYQRFLSVSREQMVAWNWATGAAWLHSDVALTLAAMGVFVVPPIVGWMRKWLTQAQDALDGRSLPGWQVSVEVLLVVVAFIPGLAIAASVAVHRLGWSGGAALFVGASWLLLFRSGGPVHRHCRHLIYGEPLFSRASAPVPARQR